MSEEKVEPSISPMFFIKNLKSIIKMMLSNQDKLENFIDSNKRLSDVLIPSFEGTGGPMEEGMIYLMFNSEGGGEVLEIDSVYRIFWVTSSQLKFHQLDAYLISEKFDNRQWVKFYDDLKFKDLSKNRFHQEVDTKEFDMLMDGTWQEGYKFNFNDKKNNISANLKYSPISPRGTLVYYNGRIAVASEAYQRFYDSFGIKIEGDITIDGETIDVIGRGIIEHGIGIFGTKVFKGWHWLNLQMENGALHVFKHPVRRPDGSGYDAGEGAMVLNGKWFHFLKDDIKITTTETETENGTEIPINWKLEVNIDDPKQELNLSMNIESTTKKFWEVEISDEETHHVTNYVLKSSGKINGETISSSGTMEIVEINVTEK